MSDESREAFEARGKNSNRLLWKRGGSVFAEDVPESDYVDAGVQREWLLWLEAWDASRLAALAESAQKFEEMAREAEGFTEVNWAFSHAAEVLRAFATPTNERPAALKE